MNRSVSYALALFIPFALLHSPTSASAQEGFGLKGHLVYNASTAQTFRDQPDVSLSSDFSGFNIGAEYVFGFGLGLSATGYASGDPRDTDRATVFMVLAEANYYFDVPVLPLYPFAGLHVGLGSFNWDIREEVLGDGALQNVERANLGWQLGARMRVAGPLSIEAMYRRLSASARSQSPGFESDQVLVGVRLF